MKGRRAMGTMNEAVSSAMNKDGSMAEAERHVRLERGYKRVSDAVAYGLLVYTALQIFMTMHAVESEEDTMLPTFALVVLVAAIIPLYRRFEKRGDTRAPLLIETPDHFEAVLRRTLAGIWTVSIGLPLLVTALIKAIAAFA